MRNFAGGINLAKGELNLKAEENIESRNMRYERDGGVSTGRGYGSPGWAWEETGHGIDGLFVGANYPNLIWAAVNGKIKYVDATITPQSSATVYTADTAISLTAGSPVFMGEYRGEIYYCNGSNTLGRIAVGQLKTALTTSASPITIDVVDSGLYSWTVSGHGTNEYYLRTLGSANPQIPQPTSFKENGIAISTAAIGSLTGGTWNYGNNDGLGYNTIYVRETDGQDPDNHANGYLQAIFSSVLYLNAAEGYKFTNGTDKVYIENDEIDYTGEYVHNSDEILTGVSNVASIHAVGSYVTEQGSITTVGQAFSPPPDLRPSCFAFFKETMWLGGLTDEPNVLRYGKSITSVSTIVDGDIHNFSDGNNYLIGEGGQITALKTTRDRLYVFLKDRIYYITTQANSSGVEVFTKEFLFSSIFGAPNQYCICEMGDKLVVFTGKRIIQIGYNPGFQQILPDEEFDNNIQPLLQSCDIDQTGAEVFYNEDDKELRVKFKINGIFKTAIYNNIVKQWSYPSDEDVSRFIKHLKNTYFGDPSDCIVNRLGLSLDAGDSSITHRYVSGRNDGASRNQKLFIRGKIEGTKRPGNTLYLTTYIDNQAFGGARPITDAQISAASPGDPLGGNDFGEETIGGQIDTPSRKNFTYPFLIGRRGKDIRFVFTSDEIGSDWEITKGEVEYEENSRDAALHY